MTVQETVQQLQQTPLSYRIQVMELLLQSFKAEIAKTPSFQVAYRPFRVRTINLKTDIEIDREEMYAERGA